jgi:hypothetical protein
MPLIASRASAAVGAGFGRVVAAAYTPDGAFYALASTTLSSTTTSVTFSGIPTGYRYLQVRTSTRASTGAGDGSLYITFNGDTGSNYSYHRMYGYGGGSSTGSGDTTSSTTAAFAGHSMGASPLTSSFPMAVINITDYDQSDKYKPVRTFAGSNMNTSSGSYGAVWLASSMYMKLGAISSLTITTSQTSFVANSVFSLYGVR